MPTFNFNVLEPDPLPEDVFVFTDPKLEKYGVGPMRLKALDNLEQFVVASISAEYTRKYITDGTPFPPVAGQVIQVTPELFQAAAMISTMHVPDDDAGADRYTVELLIAMAKTCQRDFTRLLQFAGDLQARAGDSADVKSPAATEPASEPLPTTSTITLA